MFSEFYSVEARFGKYEIILSRAQSIRSLYMSNQGHMCIAASYVPA